MTTNRFDDVEDRQAELRAVLFRPVGADGIYARTALYEDILERLGALISRYRQPGAEVLRFPPVMSRASLERSGYLKSFPNLIGCCCALHGGETEIRAAASRPGSGWTDSLAATELVLSPAACYPLYPLVAARGALPPGGGLFDVASDCFRREPSRDLDRLQSFRMREFVRIGTPDDIHVFRQHWLQRVGELADELALPFHVDQASDPFFGRLGQVMAAAQVQQALKMEVLVPLHSAQRPTACMSLNSHRDHFGTTWDLRDADGTTAHTACVAFGMDRLTLALFWIHGSALATWPTSVRRALAL